MSLYYQDDHVTLYHGDSLEILPTLDGPFDVLLTDPPYFKVKQDEWDNQWEKAGEFLGWMGEWLDHTKPLLAPHASVWVFASPAMTSPVERLVGERFRVLNSIRWIKEQGWHQKVNLPNMRRFLTPWEGVVFAEQVGRTHEPLRQYFLSGLKSSGKKMSHVDAAWQEMRGTKGCVAIHWFGETQWWMPTKEHYDLMQSALGVSHLPWTYDEVLAEYEGTRRPFNITDKVAHTDVWTFPPVKPYRGKHPCEKPQDMLTHMIRVSSRPGQLVLDPFAGSGSTLLAARNEGRRAVGIEKDEAWCEKIATRLSENTLPITA